MGILEELIKTMKLRHEVYYHSPKIVKNDPPDCTLSDNEGRVVAVEIVELVSEEAVRNTEQGKSALKYWSREEVEKKIATILREKDGKSYHGGPYSKKIVLIHTDEYTMSYEAYARHLREIYFSGYKQVDEAYLLFSFDPSEECCPYVRLNVSKDNPSS